MVSAPSASHSTPLLAALVLSMLVSMGSSVLGCMSPPPLPAPPMKPSHQPPTLPPCKVQHSYCKVPSS
ncbi:hypothetical protein ACOSQ2_026472 [Xanthoceras sorbifolium]